MPETSPKPILAGAAKCDITPNTPVFLGGYGVGPVRRARGIALRLYSRALALSDGETTVAILAIDTQGLLAAYGGGAWGHFDIETAVRAARPEIDAVFSTSTHTHTGPDSTGVWGGLKPPERDRIVEGSVRAVIDSVDALTPTTLSIGIADASGLLQNQCDFEPHREVDGRLVVIEAESIGRVVVTSAHATVASGAEISSDWYGQLATTVDDDRGGTTVVIPGAIGRTQPAIRGDGGRAAVVTYASKVRERLVEAEAALTPVDVSRGIAFERRLVSAAMTNPLLAVISRTIGRRDPWPDPPGNGRLLTSTRTQISALRIGSLLLAGFPGEAYPNLGWALEGVAAIETVIPVSLVGDQIGYLIYPRSSYPRLLVDAYKNDNSYFCASPSMGERLLAEMMDAAGATTK